MTHYRKNKNGREFFSIEGELVIRVLNKEKQSRIEIVENWLARDLACDPYHTEETTEEEFNSAYKEAFDRIALMKIV